MVASCGGCEACAFVERLPWGRQACRKSRENHATLAARRAAVTPFLCHMGFSCVAAAVRQPDDDANADYAALVAGPFCPEGPKDALEQGVRKGLAKLRAEAGDTLPFSLEDIPARRAESVVACVTWLRETLETIPTRDTAGPDEHVSGPAPRSTARRTRHSAPQDPYLGNAIALAMAGRNQDQARALVRSVLGDTPAGATKLDDARRARAIGVAGAVLEAAERAGLDTGAAWEKFPALIATAHDEDNDAVLAVMRVIGALKKRRRNATPSTDPLVVLSGMLAERLADKLLLGEAAERLGLSPSGLTRRLERKFGMTYTEYCGRLRVDKSKALLRDTALDIGAIGRRVGIDDGSNFAKLFRKYEGTSPTRYRNQHRQR